MGGKDGAISYILQSQATIPVIIVVFISIALYNVVELIVLALGTFRKYTGLYFWSVLIATLGIAFNGVGYLLKHLELTPIANIYATIILIGWCTMVTGQSVVLYSRLHLVVRNQKQLRLILAMIIFNALWLDIPITILVYGSNSHNPGPFIGPYSVFEKIQLTVFFIQETIISAIYVWKTSELLKMEKAIGNRRTQRVMNHLIYINLVIIALDITILALEYANQYNIQTAWKPFVYSVKLKMEFSVLNRLMDMVQGSKNGSSFGRSRDTAHTKSVPLETFRSERHGELRNENREFKPGYSVNVGVGQGKQTMKYNNSSVIKTTEVTIHSEGRHKDIEGDRVSLDGKSRMTGESAVEEARETRRTSSASSEIHFARSQT